jgi:hypothetical protein
MYPNESHYGYCDSSALNWEHELCQRDSFAIWIPHSTAHLTFALKALYILNKSSLPTTITTPGRLRVDCASLFRLRTLKNRAKERRFIYCFRLSHLPFFRGSQESQTWNSASALFPSSSRPPSASCTVTMINTAPGSTLTSRSGSQWASSKILNASVIELVLATVLTGYSLLYVIRKYSYRCASGVETVER